jgi:catechol 2,3-dioxygenase-like lactoylglutathione lyase family enzyme
MLTGLDHIGLTVADLDNAIRFYRDLLGVEPEFRRIFDAAYTSEQIGYPDARLDVAHFRLPGAAARLELIQYLTPTGTAIDPESKNPGTAHICLSCDDIDAEYDRLVAIGATPRSPAPVRITSGPNAGKRVLYARDPEGFTIELITRSAG